MSGGQHYRQSPCEVIPGRAAVIHTGRPVVSSLSLTPTWWSPLQSGSVAAVACFGDIFSLCFSPSAVPVLLVSLFWSPIFNRTPRLVRLINC